MIKFKKMMVEGYGSIISPTKIKLNRPGVNLVIGETGAGKTTLFSPLRWVISGKSLKGTKDVKTWPWMQPEGYKGPSVTLFLEKDGKKYELHRSSKGRKELLTLKDEEGKNLLNDRKKNNQDKIFEFLGFNDEVLVHSIIFGQRMKRLIESSGPDKKKLFEEAFNASFLKDARDSSKADLDMERAELNRVEREMALLTEKIYGKEALLDRVKEERKSFKKNQKEKKNNLLIKLKNAQKEHDPSIEEGLLEVRIKNLKRRVDETNKKYYQELSDSRQKDSKLERARKNLKKAKSDKEALEWELNKVSNSISSLNADGKCPSCGGKLSDIKKAKSLKELNRSWEGIDKKLYSLETQILEFAAEVEKLEKSSKKSSKRLIDQLEKDKKNYEKKIATLEKKIFNNRIADERIKSIKASLYELEQNTPPPIPQNLVYELEDLNNGYDGYEKIREELKESVEDLNWVYNDLLGNKGLKSYIFDSMLESLNNLLVYYEQFIGFQVEFKVDLESGNKDIYTVCYKDGEMIFYEDLSGGQKQLVDAVTTFALYDLVSEDKPTNLMIMDEPFEGLSESASEIIYDLIQDKNKDDKSIFIITHNINLQNSSDKVIRVGAVNGETKLKIL